MVSCLIMLPIYILVLAISRHLSRPICFTILPICIIATNMIFMESGALMIGLQIFVHMLLFCIYCIIQSKIKYDFSRKIISYTYIINSLIKTAPNDGEKIIGKVLPYSNSQLKWNGKSIKMNEIASAGITLITGSVGSGKTYGMLSLIKQNISSGKSVIFTEYKGDPKVVNEIIDFAKLHNFETFNLSFGESDFNYDPLQYLNNVGRIEAIMNMRKWSMDGSDAHYKTSVQLLLQKLVGDFSHIYKPEDGSYTMSFYMYVKTYHQTSDEWDAYKTVSKLLELLLTSSLKPMFAGKFDKTLDFHEMKNKKFLLVVSFVSSNKELATSFSSLLFRDLLDECTVETPLSNINLYMDETGTLENPFIIKDILEKGRSGKVATTLAMQDINQVVIQTNEAYLDSILGIINTFIIYSGATRATAEKLAGVQLMEIEGILMNLRKPINGHGPTAIYISKYPSLNKRTNTEVFRFEPYIYKTGHMNVKNGNIFDANVESNDQNLIGHFNEDNFNSMNEVNMVLGHDDDDKRVDFTDFI